MTEIRSSGWTLSCSRPESSLPSLYAFVCCPRARVKGRRPNVWWSLAQRLERRGMSHIWPRFPPGASRRNIDPAVTADSDGD